MGPLQTKQLEKQHVQWWQGGTLPKIPQPVDLCPFTFCVFISLWSAVPWHNTPIQMSLTSWNMMSWLPLLNRFSRESNQMRKRFSKIKFCSLLIGSTIVVPTAWEPKREKKCQPSLLMHYGASLWNTVTPCVCVFFFWAQWMESPFPFMNTDCMWQT